MVDPDELDEELEELEDLDAGGADRTSQDPSLTLFLRRPPSGADHVVVLACTTNGEQVVQDRDASEASRPGELADLILDGVSRWAAAEGKRTRFRLCWQVGDRVLASHQIVSGDGDPGALDGSVNSFFMQNQRHAEQMHRIQHDGFEMVQGSWEKLQKATMVRIEALERDNQELRDRLRKAGDVEAEIAFSTVAADIEQRQRTTEILEARFMPIIQQLLMSRLAPHLAQGQGSVTGDTIAQVLGALANKQMQPPAAEETQHAKQAKPS